MNFLYTPRIPANFKDYVNSQIISTIPYNNHESRIKLKRWFIFSNPRRDDVKYGVQVNCIGRHCMKKGLWYSFWFPRTHDTADTFFFKILWPNFTFCRQIYIYLFCTFTDNLTLIWPCKHHFFLKGIWRHWKINWLIQILLLTDSSSRETCERQIHEL